VYLVTCCDKSIRLYSVDLLARGERTTLRKELLPVRALDATVVDCGAQDSLVAAGSACCVLTEQSHLLVYSLPDLTSIWRSSLRACLGWDAPLSPGTRVFASHCGLPENLTLMLPGPELLELQLSMDAQPVASEKLYDADLDIAASAASSACRRAAREGGSSSPGALAASEGPREPEGKGKAKTRIGAFMARAKEELNQKLARNTGPKAFVPAEQLTARDLEALFGVSSETAGASSAASVTHTAAAESRREELLAGARKGWKEKRGPRSADEIRAAYGRPARKAKDEAQAASSTMERNRQALLERGEKLQELSEKTQELQNEAASFADMAKQLRQQQERSWW